MESRSATARPRLSPSSTRAPISAGSVNGVISVKAPPYLAKGDGTTDDTAAIQGAINAACAGSGNNKPEVYLPATPGSSYKITSPLLINCALKFTGAGWQQTQITQNYFGPTIVAQEAENGWKPPLASSVTATWTASRSYAQYKELLDSHGNVEVQTASACTSGSGSADLAADSGQYGHGQHLHLAARDDRHATRERQRVVARRGKPGVLAGRGGWKQQRHRRDRQPSRSRKPVERAIALHYRVLLQQRRADWSGRILHGRHGSRRARKYEYASLPDSAQRRLRFVPSQLRSGHPRHRRLARRFAARDFRGRRCARHHSPCSRHLRRFDRDVVVGRHFHFDRFRQRLAHCFALREFRDRGPGRGVYPGMQYATTSFAGLL